MTLGSMPGEKSFHAASAAVLMEMGTSFGNVLTPPPPPSPLVQIRENLEFHVLIQRDKRTWPRCLLWHGWLPALDGTGGWAVGLGRVSANVLETRLGGYSVIGLALRTLLLGLALGFLLPIRMFGRMECWCVMRSRVSAVGGLVCLR